MQVKFRIRVKQANRLVLMEPKRLIYRIFVPAMGTTLEFSDKGAFDQYKEMFAETGWEYETNIQPL